MRDELREIVVGSPAASFTLELVLHREFQNAPASFPRWEARRCVVGRKLTTRSEGQVGVVL